MATKQFNSRIQWKKDTSANWTANNPVLLNGEIAIVVTNAGETRFKVGDGTSSYTALPFQDEAIRALISSAQSSITNHINNKNNPHEVTASQVDYTPVPGGHITAANIQDALESLDTMGGQLLTELSAHISDKSNPHGVSKSQVGLSNVDNVRQYSTSNPPPYPVTSVNGSTGAVNLTANSVNAIPAVNGSIGQFLGFTSTNVVGAVNAPGGVDIQVNSSQPSGQSAGDFWYQIV